MNRDVPRLVRETVFPDPTLPRGAATLFGLLCGQVFLVVTTAYVLKMLVG
jgi:hypothetical protein